MVAGFGILFCLVSTFLVFCPLLSLLAKVPRIAYRRGAPRRNTDGVGGAASRQEEAAVVIAVFSVLLLLAAAGAARTRFDAGVEAIGLANSEVRNVERAVEAKFGRKGEPLFLVARADNDARLAEDFDAPRSPGGAVAAVAERSARSLPPRCCSLLRIGRRSRGDLLSDAGLPGRYDGPGLERAIRREMEAQGMVPGDGLAAYAAGIVRRPRPGRGRRPAGLARSGDPRATYFFNGSRMRSPPTWRRPADGGVKGRSPP